MTYTLLFGIFIVFYRENSDIVHIRALGNLKGGVLAGFSLNRTDSKLGNKHDTEPVASGGYGGRVWKIFDFEESLALGLEVGFKEREVSVSGLYSDTSIEGLTLYSVIEHFEKGDEISATIPFRLKVYKNLSAISSMEFSWRRALIQHGDAYTNYSMEIVELNASELHLAGRIGAEFKTDLFNLSLSAGVPLLLRGEAEMLRYLLKEKGATIVVEPLVKWNYDPKPPPFIKTLMGYRYRNFSLFLTYSFTGEWGGGFHGVERTQYRLEGIPSGKVEFITSYRVLNNEFLMGLNYEERDYKTENVPALNGDRFLVLLGYIRNNHLHYGLFLRCLFSDMDYKSLRNMSVFLTRITMDFFIGF